MEDMTEYYSSLSQSDYDFAKIEFWDRNKTLDACRSHSFEAGTESLLSSIPSSSFTLGVLIFLILFVRIV